MLTLKELMHLTDVSLACTFLLAGILLSIITKFPQLRKIKEFVRILRKQRPHETSSNVMTPLHALYTAMTTSLGMGNILTPPIAIAIGGPGALFWMGIYAFFGSVTKFAEVTFAVKFKRYAHDGTIIGGPTAYLYQIHPMMANWYGILSIVLFSAWSALQSQALATTYSYYGVPQPVTGAALAFFIFFMLLSGTKSIGNFTSKLIPLMYTIYLVSAFFILFANVTLLKYAIISIFTHAFSPTAAVGGFIGSTLFMGLREGIFKGAFTTEAGIGTAAIAHAYSDTPAEHATQQGILGMYSIFMNTLLCIISGLISLTTGTWMLAAPSTDLAMQAFKSFLPSFGPLAITTTLTMCIIGATLGNSFNGSKCFGFFTNNRWLHPYYMAVSGIIFIAPFIQASWLWSAAELILPLIALPNLFGLFILTKRYRNELSA